MSLSQHVNIQGYELVRELGVGGMATVFLAIQTSLDRKVALKVMRRNIDDVDKFERRFLMEGRTLAKLPHRNIVAVYDIVKGDATTYIAMEYLDGGTLHERMRDGLSLAEAVAIVVQIGGALQFAHDHGVIHRDLKPSNIMFRDESTPVLTDFGIAKQQDSQQQTRLTQTGMLVGTPTYMSPEQINALEVDGRSDLYSLGVMFYELLTGTAPFQGDTPIAVLMAHLTTPAPPLPYAFAEFQPVIDRMLAKNRDDRFLNLKEFTKALKAVVIANETLWARLQADPNQSSSEQLRALGFSISAQTAGDLQQPLGVRRTGQAAQPSGRVSAPSSQATQVAGAAPQRTLDRTGPGVPIGVAPQPTPLPAPSPLPPPKSRWPLFAGIGGLLAIVVVVGLWFGLRDTSEIDPKLKGRVDGLLGVVDRQIADGKLVPPPLGDNALDILREAQELAPTYAETGKRRDALLAAIMKSANGDVLAGEFEDAKTLQSFAADLAGDSPEVQALQKAIADAQMAKANAAEIKRLLSGAEAALSAGREFGADSAYALLNGAQRLGPTSAEVKAFRAKLMTRVLSPVRSDITAGRLADAEAKLKQLETDLGNDLDWRALSADVAKLQAQRDLDGRMNQLYVRLEAQVRAGKLLAPAGDSALESLREAEALDQAHAGLPQRRQDLVTALLRAGRKDLDSNRAVSAVRQADAVLAIDATNADAQSLKKSAESELGESERKLAQMLADAQNAVLDGALYSPPGNNARELANAALKLDPANAEAKKLLADLPGLAAAKVKTLLAADDFAGAEKLAKEAAGVHPDDAALRALVTDVAARVTARALQQKRGEQIEAVFAVAAAQPLVPADVERAIGSIDDLLRANPRDVDALTARKRLLDALLGSARSAASSSEFAGFDRLLGVYATRFSNDAALSGVRTQFAEVKARILADEAKRLTESAGRLVLVAAPWGQVDSVVNSVTAQSVTLPADRSTPLVLTVPAGVYRVTFSHPNARTVTQVGELKARSEAQVVATFPSLGKEEYLRRAGL